MLSSSLSLSGYAKTHKLLMSPFNHVSLAYLRTCVFDEVGKGESWVDSDVVGTGVR